MNFDIKVFNGFEVNLGFKVFERRVGGFVFVLGRLDKCGEMVWINDWFL